MERSLIRGYHFTMLPGGAWTTEGDSRIYTGPCDLEMDFVSDGSVMHLPAHYAFRVVSFTLPGRRPEPAVPSTQSTTPCGPIADGPRYSDGPQRNFRHGKSRRKAFHHDQKPYNLPTKNQQRSFKPNDDPGFQPGDGNNQMKNTPPRCPKCKGRHFNPNCPICYYCNQIGHIRAVCPQRKQERMYTVQVARPQVGIAGPSRRCTMCDDVDFASASERR